MTTREIDLRVADMRCRALEPGSNKHDEFVQQCQEPLTFVLATGRMVPEDPGTRDINDSLAYFSIYCPVHRAANNAMWGQRDARGNRVGVQRILDFQTADAWIDPVEGGERDEGRTRVTDLHHSNLGFDFLFVVKDAGSTTIPDQEIIDRLERFGATVLLKSEDDTYIDTDSNWELSDAAGVSESVSSSTVGTSGKDADVGAVAWEPGIWDDWEFASVAGANTSDDDRAQFPIIHPLGGGAAGNRTVPRVSAQIVDNAIASSRIFSASNTSQLGPDVARAMITSSVDTRFICYGYDTGDEMDSSFTAPNRRVANGFLRVDPSAGTEAVNESTAGYVLNEAGWALGVDIPVLWVLATSLSADLQLGFPVTESDLGSWTAPTNGVLDIDDEAPNISDFYESGTSDTVLVLKLTTLTDPVNDSLHHLVAAFAKSGTGSATPSITLELRQGWTSEPSSLGTLIGTVDGIVSDGNVTEYGGIFLILTETEADNITDYSDLYARLVYTADTNREIRIANVRWLIDGADAGVTVNLTPSAVTVSGQTSSPVLTALDVTASPSLLTALATASLPALSQLDLPLSPALLSADAQAALPALAQLDVQATSAPITVTSQPVTPVIAGGQVDITAVPALMAANAQVASAVLAALAITATPAPITALPTASSPVLSSLAINANPALLSVSAQTVSAILSALAVQVTPALLNAIAQAANPVVEGGAILATPAALTLGSQIADPVEAALAISAASVAMSVLGQVVDPIHAALAVNAVPAIVALAAQTGQPSLSALSLQLTPVTVAVNGQILNALLANLIVQATPAVIAVNGQVADATFAVLAIQAIPSVLIVAAQLLEPPPIPGLAAHFRRTSITQQGLETGVTQQGMKVSVTSPGHIVIIDKGS